MVRPCRAERAVPDYPGTVPPEIRPSGAGQPVPEPGPGQRAAFLASSVDPLPFSPAQAQGLDGFPATAPPADIETLEWFASPDDICRAFAGLQQLAARPGLAPLGSILSANDGGIGLEPAQWPTVWFKGGSEPGVLTLGLSGHEQQRPDLRGSRNARQPGRATALGGRVHTAGNCHGRVRASPIDRAWAGGAHIGPPQTAGTSPARQLAGCAGAAARQAEAPKFRHRSGASARAAS